MCQRRENLGVELYGVQQQLARQQMVMEKELDELAALKQTREQKEIILSQVKDVHQKLKMQLKKTEEQGTCILHWSVSWTSLHKFHL